MREGDRVRGAADRGAAGRGLPPARLPPGLAHAPHPRDLLGLPQEGRQGLRLRAPARLSRRPRPIQPVPDPRPARPALCWFRRNLRLDDNPTLAAALAAEGLVVPVFVLDDHYVEESGDFSPPRLAFLADSLRDLADALASRGSRLVVRPGPAGRALAALAAETGAREVFVPRDHEPHAKELDREAAAALGRVGVRLVPVEDHLLVPAAALRTGSGRPYTVFTPFSRRWLEADKASPVPEPGEVPTPPGVLDPSFRSVPLEKVRGLRVPGPAGGPKGGSTEGRALWDRFRAGALASYAEGRDRPSIEGTSRLSPHLRFGTVGVRRLLAGTREAWKAASPPGRASVETFVKELAWREFYAGVLDAFPHSAEGNFRSEYDRFPWVSGKEKERRLAAWKEGLTGYPIVDAGMRQLRHEGWMHNRVRMIVASFLCKDLLVDWREGERFFRASLADGDVASNAGGWQWAAGSGTDAQPFFRIFNPVSQGLRFDPDGTYVKRWLPELARWKSGGEKAIHSPWLAASPPRGYPAPLVDHARARAEALQAFANLRAGSP